MADGGGLVQLRTMNYEYVYDHRIADCTSCPLAPSRDHTICLAARPESFNGLMIIGEGPGSNEAREKVPFIGQSGQLLNALLAQAGIERANTYITNATLCMPPRMPTQKEKDAVVAEAVKQCRKRLLTEIQHVRPRIIVALGNHAMNALLGVETVVNKRVPFDCPSCGNARKWKVWGCSRCKRTFDGAVDGDRVLPRLSVVGDEKPAGSPCDIYPSDCNIETKKKPSKFQKRTIECVNCGGLKTRVESTLHFKSDYKLSEVAGGIFPLSSTPIGAYVENPDGVFLIPSYHPAALLYETKTKAQKSIGGQFLANAVLKHLQKANRLLGSDPQWAFRWERVDDPDIIRERLAVCDDWSVDTETDAKEVEKVANIKCIAFTPLSDPGYAMVVDTEGLAFDHPRVAVVLDFLKDWVKRKGFHNGFGYDAHVIKHIWGVDLAGYAWDGMIDHNAIAPDEPHSLAHVVFETTDAQAWKPPKSKGGMLSFETKDELHAYCAKDTVGLAHAHLALRAEQARENTTAVADIDMKKAILGLEMSKRGMAVDREKMLIIGAKEQARMEKHKKWMCDFIGRLPEHVRPKDAKEGDPYLFNPNSHKQLLWALYDPEGPCRLVPAAYTDDTCKVPSTEESALIPHDGVEFVGHLIAYRHHRQNKSVWIDGMPVGADMRLHAFWNPIGARTGRYSTSPNFQNWKKWLRSMIVAPPGRKIVGADKAQLEMRVLGGLSSDRELIRRIEEADESRKLEADYDTHSYVATLAFGETFTSLLLKDPSHSKELAEEGECPCQTCLRKLLRETAKSTVYGLNYGAGPDKVKETIYAKGYNGPPLSREMIQKTMDAYFRAFPDVQVWRDEQLRIAERSGRIYDAMLGRYREFPLATTPWAGIDPTVVYNFPIQSTAASVMDIALWNFYCRLPDVDPSAFLIAQVHDAIYAETDENKAEAVAKLLEDCMNCEVVLREGGHPVRLTASAAIADNWMEAA